MLGSARPISFVTTARPEEARRFYEDVLQLRFVEDTPFALVFDAAGTMLRIQKVERFAPPQGTALGWAVSDIRAAVRGLRLAGVSFNRYDGMPQDEDAIWSTPDGSLVAWFSDPDGNTLSLTQFARQEAGGP